MGCADEALTDELERTLYPPGDASSQGSTSYAASGALPVSWPPRICFDAAQTPPSYRVEALWRFGRQQLLHWVDVLDRFDDILEASSMPAQVGILGKWDLLADDPDATQVVFFLLLPFSIYIVIIDIFIVLCSSCSSHTRP